MEQEYSVSSIKVMEGLDAVRMRPGMYIGSTGPQGLHHLLWEIVDNAVDEAANGFANEISVTIHRDDSVTVTDNGRGIPVGTHEKLGVSGVEVVFTQLHAGGKFGNDSYGYSGGLHGVGASVVNALSEWVKVEVCTQGRRYEMSFASPEEDGHIVSGKVAEPLTETGRTRKQGTTVTFLPDKRVFHPTVSMEHKTVAKRLRELAYLNRGVRFVFTDERKKPEERTVEYRYDGGLSDFVSYLNNGQTPLYDAPVHFVGESNGIVVELAFQHNDSYTETLFSFVNNISTTEGGMHETGFKSAYTKVMNECARRIGVLKDKDPNFEGADYSEGRTAVLSLKMRNVEFEGQTKTKLGNLEAKTAVEAVVSECLTQFMEDLKNGPVAQAVLEKAVKAAKVREQLKKEKKKAREKNKLDIAPLVGKLSSCTGRDASKNELFIVEGDSAGGSAKKGRDRKFQAILPLRGKPLNVEKQREDKVLQNEEFRTLISALGTGFGEDFDLSGLKYDKVVILSDADQDGYHIRAILLTFFYRYMKPLITEGHVYIGLPPLYMVSKGEKKTYCYDDAEMTKALRAYGKGAKVQRYKGLGEMDAEQLWETTMDPHNRMLQRVSIENPGEVESRVTVLMGDKAQPRREYIFRNANFNKEKTAFDEFADKQEKKA